MEKRGLLTRLARLQNARLESAPHDEQSDLDHLQLGGSSQGSRSSDGDLPLRFQVHALAVNFRQDRNSDDLGQAVVRVSLCTADPGSRLDAHRCSIISRCFSRRGSWISIGLWSARMPWKRCNRDVSEAEAFGHASVRQTHQ
jgi:hypothetical protein